MLTAHSHLWVILLLHLPYDVDLWTSWKGNYNWSLLSLLILQNTLIHGRVHTGNGSWFNALIFSHVTLIYSTWTTRLALPTWARVVGLWCLISTIELDLLEFKLSLGLWLLGTLTWSLCQLVVLKIFSAFGMRQERLLGLFVLLLAFGVGWSLLCLGLLGSVWANWLVAS